MSKAKFTTIRASEKLMESMEVAINNMIEEVKKPVDPEAEEPLGRLSFSQSSRQRWIARSLSSKDRGWNRWLKT